MRLKLRPEYLPWAAAVWLLPRAGAEVRSPAILVRAAQAL